MAREKQQKPTKSTGTVPGPKIEEIAELAYSYWEARNGEGGSAEEDWLRAERELTLAMTQRLGAERVGSPVRSESRQRAENTGKKYRAVAP